MEKMARVQAIIMANLKASPAKSAILLIGTLVLIFLLVRQLTKGPEQAEGMEIAVGLQSPVETGVEEPVNSTSSVTKKISRHPRPRIARTLTRNPFGTAWMGPLDLGDTDGEEGGLEDELILQFTMLGENQKEGKAVISGMVVYPGSRIAGYEVVTIGNRYVVLSKGSEKITLQMP